MNWFNIYCFITVIDKINYYVKPYFTSKLSDYCKNLTTEIKEQIQIESHYLGYLQRQKIDIEYFKKDENLLFPNNFDFNKVGSLSNEILEKLNKIQPPTIGAASRISGVTPPAIVALLRHVKKKRISKKTIL